jgi:hypothetical protein
MSGTNRDRRDTGSIHYCIIFAAREISYLVVRTKAEMVSAYDSGKLKYESVKFDEIKVHPYGETAVVTARSTAKGQDNGKDFSGQYRYTRVYVKRQGRWQLVATQSTRIP